MELQKGDVIESHWGMGEGKCAEVVGFSDDQRGPICSEGCVYFHTTDEGRDFMFHYKATSIERFIVLGTLTLWRDGRIVTINEKEAV